MTPENLVKHSYVPYSGQPEIAVVQGKNGDLYPGVRIENVSFPLTITALQNALFYCLSEQDKPEHVYLSKSAAQMPDLNFWQEHYSFEVDDIDKLDTIDAPSGVESVEDISATLKELLKRSLATESDFPVSALLETESGFISGVNIELTDWSRGLCAERLALAKAVTLGFTNFKSLHIHTRDGEYSSPCGACRQVIIEHLPHHPVHLHHADGSRSNHFTSDLLPYSFQSSSLQNKSEKL